MASIDVVMKVLASLEARRVLIAHGSLANRLPENSNVSYAVGLSSGRYQGLMEAELIIREIIADKDTDKA